MEIAIIGAGASGLAAAVAAAGRPGVHVTVLERQNRAGRKLLATGNGRCNLSNTGPAEGRYHGEEPGFSRTVLEARPPAAVLEFFAGLGLMTAEEYGGRVYPMSGFAGSVLDVLRTEAERLGAEVRTAAAVAALRRKRDGFWLEWAGGGLRADKVIVACGGCAGGKLGGVEDGYALLRGLGHSVTALAPGLAPLRTEPAYPRALKGIRADAGVALRRGGRTLAEERGDLLFTETGVSGTAVFALTRLAGDRWAGEKHTGGVFPARRGLSLSLDFFPDRSPGELSAELRQRRRRWGDRPANLLLTGTVHPRLGLMLCKAAGIGGGSPAADVPDRTLEALAVLMKGFPLPVTGVGGFDTAQVTAGGVRTAEFRPDTLESRLVPGLYACGEVLDVDGDCGGYNLQWAWASGLTAGETR